LVVSVSARFKKAASRFRTYNIFFDLAIVFFVLRQAGVHTVLALPLRETPPVTLFEVDTGGVVEGHDLLDLVIANAAP
jgi:hypothetical protein